MFAAYSIAFIVSAALSLTVAVAAWRRRPAPGALGLSLLCAAQFLWSGTFALQWMFTDHSPSLPWLLARLTGLQFTPTFILFLVLDFTGRRNWLTGRRVALLLVQPIAIVAAVVTDPWHGLYLGGNPPTMRFMQGGPLFGLNIIYSYGILIVAAALLAMRLSRRFPYRQQTGVVLVAVMLPVVHFLAELGGLRLLPEINSVPFTFTISGLLKLYALTRLGLFRVIPIARDLLVEQLPEGIIVFDADQRVADINPAATRMMRARQPCVGQRVSEAFPEQMQVLAALAEGLLTGSDRVVERGTTASGEAMEATATRVVDREGQQLGTLVSLRDVSEQIRIAEELQTRGEQLAAALERSRSILAAMTDGVLLVDEDGRLLHTNPAASQILGLPDDGVEGQYAAALVPDLPAASLAETARTTGDPVIESLVLDDGRTLVVEAVPLVHGVAHSARTVLIIRDETDRLAAERMQREFVANVAHELQTPLTGLSLLSDTIPHALRTDPETAERFIGRLSSEVSRLSRMTNELMTLSRVDSDSPNGAAADESERTVDFSALAAEEADAIRLQAEAKRQTLTIDIEAAVQVAASELDARVIVSNLLENAVRYTDEGGSIGLRLFVESGDRGDSDPGHPGGTDSRDHQLARLEVTDDGIGIPTEDLGRVFERFYRVDKARSRRTGGAGLGLSIVRGAVERSGGSIALESELGRGSTFTVRLPLAK